MYKHILLATDFSPEARFAEVRAEQESMLHMSKLSVVHAIDYFPSAQFEGGLAYLPDIESKLQENAEKEMAACVKRLSLKAEQAHIGHGQPKTVITDYANEMAVDLIVMGSHGRHGLGLLLGSTANGVLHVAKCDVLAVRVYE